MHRCFKYDPLAKSYMWLGRLLSMFLMAIGLFFAAGAFYVQIFREHQFASALTIFTTVSVILSMSHFILTWNYAPDICISEENLYVNFFFKQKRVKLGNLVGVKRIFTPTLRKKGGFILLFKEGLTPFHRIYGWIFGRSFHPGIVVLSSISDRDELERLILKYSQNRPSE